MDGDRSGHRVRFAQRSEVRVRSLNQPKEAKAERGLGTALPRELCFRRRRKAILTCSLWFYHHKIISIPSQCQAQHLRLRARRYDSARGGCRQLHSPSPSSCHEHALPRKVVGAMSLSRRPRTPPSTSNRLSRQTRRLSLQRLV